MQEDGVFTANFQNQSLTKKLVLKGIFIEENNSITLSLLKGYGSQEIFSTEIKLGQNNIEDFIINNSSQIYSQLTKTFIERKKERKSPEIQLTPPPPPPIFGNIPQPFMPFNRPPIRYDPVYPPGLFPQGDPFDPNNMFRRGNRRDFGNTHPDLFYPPQG